MAVEAQRLMAMSLGKITASRQQRGGINLHKNLLVAGVLYKARTAFMNENYQAIMKSQKYENSCIQEQDDRDNSSLQSCMENSEPCGEEKGMIPMEDRPSEECTEEMEMDKENSPPTSDMSCSDDDDQVVPSFSQCASRTKRSYSEVDTSCVSDESCQKKMRVLETSSPNSNVLQQEKNNVCEKSVELPVENGVQISNLVNSFNGLLNATAAAAAIQADNKLVSHSDLQSGLSDNSNMVSCSTQIKEAFETLSRPILAMTV